LTEGKIGVLTVSSLFYVDVRVCIRTHTHTLHRWGTRSVCGCTCVYTHTHTHTAQMGNSDVSPGVEMRHLEGPKNPDGPNLGIHIFVYVYKVHMCMYVLRGGMRSWANCFFL